MLSDISWRRVLTESFLVILGSAIYALGVDIFEIPNGLAAGGLTGLATILSAVAAELGIIAPVGLQTILMNVALLVFVVVTTHDWTYVARSIFGILVSGFLPTCLRRLSRILLLTNYCLRPFGAA